MKVLIVHPCKGFYGGAEEVIVQLKDYLHKCGHKWVFITMGAPATMIEKMSGSHNYICKGYNEFRHCTQVWRKWADVINIHNFPATLATFLNKKPIVWYCNEPPELFTNWKRKPIEVLNRWWVKKSGMKVIVADQMNANRFSKIYGVEPMIIPYGINYTFWSKEDLFQERKGDTLKLLQVGTITPYKNQLASIMATKQLNEWGINAELTLAGGTPDKRYYSNLRKSRVLLIGQRTQEEIRSLFHSHDILLHPVKGQGGWLTPFEAMCAGLPTITMSSFSASNIISEHNLGVVTENTADSIINKHVENFNTEKAKEWVKENLTWGKFGENMVKVFEETINTQKEN